MTRTRATLVAFFAGLGFFHCVSRILQVAFALQTEDPPSRAWAAGQLLRWTGSALALFVLTAWGIYKVWQLWDAQS